MNDEGFSGTVLRCTYSTHIDGTVSVTGVLLRSEDGELEGWHNLMPLERKTFPSPEVYREWIAGPPRFLATQTDDSFVLVISD